MFLESLRLDGLLSFAPGTPATTLGNLNVLIGPNGSGKSNFLEAIDLMRAAPRALAQAIRDGGGMREWLWKGPRPREAVDGDSAASPDAVDGRGEGDRSGFGFSAATLDARLLRPRRSTLRYYLKIAALDLRPEVVDEGLEEAEKHERRARDVYFYYRFQHGRPALNIRESGSDEPKMRRLKRESLVPDESVLSQRRDPDLYPELTWAASQFERIQVFRDWTFGRYSPIRQPQPADLPGDSLLSDARNLGLVLNRIEHGPRAARFGELLRRFLPRFQRTSTLVEGGHVQFFLHEDRSDRPIPSTRLSDGTIRFMALCAALLAPTPPPLLCIEEPELGLHPDAMAILADLLVEASTRMQIILATHSDALVSAFTDRLESVLVCEHFGGTQMRRLESARLQHWLADYRLGDLWRIGELGGNP